MNELRDKVYELEGLLELQSLRPDKAADLRHLIDGRIKEINRLWAKQNGDAECAGSNEPNESNESNESTVSDKSDLSDKSDKSDKSDLSDLSDQSDSSDLSVQPELEVSVTEEFPVEPEAPVVETQPEAAARPVPALCLNDRFRFTRVIAGGNRQAFDTILKTIATLPDYDSARDYVLTESHADPDDPEVMDFLEILQQYYE